MTVLARRKAVIPVIALAAIIVGILPAILLYPFHSDLDIHHCIGVELNRFNGPPYAGAFVSNLPGIAYIHWLAIAVFGNSVFDFRIIDYLAQIATVLALYYVSSFWVSRSSALLGCLLYALVYINGPNHFVGQPDGFAVLPIVLGVGSIVQGYRSVGVRRFLLILVGGVAFGVATCLRITFPIALFLPLLFLFNIRTREGLYALAAATLGLVVPIVLCIAVYAPTPNGILELYHSIIRYNYEVYSHNFELHDYSKRALLAGAFVILWITVVMLFRRKEWTFSSQPSSKAEQRFLIAFFCSLLLCVVIMGRLAGYHFVPFFGLFMPVLASFVEEILHRIGRWTKAIRVAMIVIVFTILTPWFLVLPFFRAPRIYATTAYVDSETQNVVSFLQDRTRPMDTVEVASFFPAVRWRVDRPLATRFNIPQCLTTKKPDGTFTEYQGDWQKEYLNRIVSVRPKYYLFQYLVDRSGAFTTYDMMAAIPGWKETLSRYYVLDTVIGSYRFYLAR